MKQGIKKRITALTITSAMVAATLGGGSFVFAAKNQPQNGGQRPSVTSGSSIGIIEEKPNKKPVTAGAIEGKPNKKPVTPGAIEGKPDKKPVTPGVIEGKPDKRPVTPGAIEGKPDKRPVTPGAIEAKPDKENDGNKPSEGNNNIKEPVTPGAITAKPELGNKTKKKAPKKVKVKKARKTARNKIQITLDGTNVWSKPSVTVKTAAGKSVKTSIIKKGKNSCVLKTKKKLNKGTYTIKIKGVKVKGETKYETITTKVKVK